MTRLFLMLTLFMVTLSACTVQRQLQRPATHDNASIKLAEAANSVSRSLIELADIQAAATPAIPDNLPDPSRLGIKAVASIDWSGPIGPLVDKLSRSIDYHTRVLGKVPAIPVIVSLHTKHIPVATILRDIDYQAGKKASIKVYPHAKVVELRYANV